MGIEGAILTAWAVYTGVSEDISPHRKQDRTISIGVHVIRYLWDGVAPPGFRSSYFAISPNRCNINRTNVSKNILKS